MSQKRIIEIDQAIKDRCIAYARQIAVYRGYDDLVDGLQPVERLIEKHGAEWIEFREAYAQKSIYHQYHEAADIFYYANQLEAQTGTSWIAADLHSLWNYGLDPEKVQRCAQLKYAWRAEAPGNKNEEYELTLIDEIFS